MYDYISLGRGIRKAIDESGKDVIVIASSDFIHYGMSYGYVPFFDNVKENLNKMDNEIFSFIEKKDSKGFIRYLDKTGATVCGRYPIATLLNIYPEAKIKKLCHYNSGDVVGDYSHCVDYISAILE